MVRQDDAKFDLLIPDEISQTYADGVAQMMIGFPMSKILFFGVSASASEQQMQEGVEVRKATFELTIPTIALLETAQNILTTIAGNNAAMLDGLNKYKAAVENQLTAAHKKT